MPDHCDRSLWHIIMRYHCDTSLWDIIVTDHCDRLMRRVPPWSDRALGDCWPRTNIVLLLVTAKTFCTGRHHKHRVSLKCLIVSWWRYDHDQGLQAYLLVNCWNSAGSFTTWPVKPSSDHSVHGGHLSLIAPSNVSFSVKGGGTFGGPQLFSFCTWKLFAY